MGSAVTMECDVTRNGDNVGAEVDLLTEPASGGGPPGVTVYAFGFDASNQLDGMGNRARFCCIMDTTGATSTLPELLGSSFDDDVDLTATHNAIVYDMACPGGAQTEADIQTGPGDDTILGSNFAATCYDENLRGQDGNDIIDGGAGGDDIFGGDGRDLLFGGTGNDTIDAGPGDDGDPSPPPMSDPRWGVYGGAGNDSLYGGTGEDHLYGEADDDQISGGPDDDLMYGNDGDDTLSGQEGLDDMNGGDGDDDMYGGTEIDTMNGGDGEDTMWGDEGGDVMRGGGEDDELHGGEGDDQMYGDGGVDTLCGDGDVSTGDRLYGGIGGDILWAEEGGDDRIDGQAPFGGLVDPDQCEVLTVPMVQNTSCESALSSPPLACQ